MAASPSPAGEQAGIVVPCNPDSRELRDAKRRLGALDERISALKPGADHTAANDELIDLAGHRCMALSGVDPASLRAEAAEALVHFWVRGRSWFEGELELATRRSVTMVPPMRKVLSAQTRPDFPMRHLLCPPADPTCGRETAGWWQRADDYMRLSARLPLRRGHDAPRATEAGCAASARSQPAGTQYQQWRLCLEELVQWGFAMPLGRVKQPTSGWLVVRGRRGHYGFCDEIRMYSLATTAAYIAQRCGQLDLSRSVASVARPVEVTRGSMSLDNTRELAWMLLQLEEVVADYPWLWQEYAIPEGIAPAMLRDVHQPAEKPVRTGWGIVSSNQTTLAWTITGEQGEELASGRLRWPSDSRGGSVDYAGTLMRVAEAGFIEGCPAQLPPEEISPGRARASVSALDASAEELRQAERELLVRLREVARTGCVQP